MIVLGGAIGGLTMIALVVATAIIGAYLTRQQGLITLIRLREKIHDHQPIMAEMIEAVILVVAGLMLILPGLITDTTGFLLLIPSLRQYCCRVIIGMIPHQSFASSPPDKNTIVIDVDINTDKQDHPHQSS